MLYFEKLAYAKRPGKSIPGVSTSPAQPEINQYPDPGFNETEKNDTPRMEETPKINPSRNEDPPLPLREQVNPKS